MLFARLFGELIKFILEFVKHFHRGLAHIGQRGRGAVLGRNLQLARNMMLHKLLEKGIIGVGH